MACLNVKQARPLLSHIKLVGFLFKLIVVMLSTYFTYVSLYPDSKHTLKIVETMTLLSIIIKEITTGLGNKLHKAEFM